MRRVLALILSVGMLFPATGSGEAAGGVPVVENLELRTFRNTSVGGTLLAEDPDGDEVFFTITTEPIKGSIDLQEDGSFVYTPREGKRGRDYFGYKAMDSRGNISQEATVIIRIEKQKKGVFYEDMRGRAEAYAAALLCEEGLFTGEQIAGLYCFSPEKPVTRGEFLTICMCLSGLPILRAVQSTGYEDDAAIPVWMKGYVVTASMRGIETEQKNGFEAGSEVTEYEAAALIRQTLGVEPTCILEGEKTLDRASMALLVANIIA